MEFVQPLDQLPCKVALTEARAMVLGEAKVVDLDEAKVVDQDKAKEESATSEKPRKLMMMAL